MKDSPDNEDKKETRGRPQGSTKVKMNLVQVEELINESMKVIIGNHYSWTEYTNWAKKKYGISGQMANEYWLRVWTHLKEKYELDRDKLITKHLSKYWGIYDQAIRNNDLSNARQTLDAITKLLGLSEPEKLDVKQELKIKFNFGTDETQEE